MRADHGDINHGTIAAGSGTLISLTGSTHTTTTVTTPIALGDGNHILRDNEANAVITAGDGDNRIAEFGAGATITTGDGDNAITDFAGGAVVSTGTGDASINLGGVGNSVTVGPTNSGRWDVSFINAGSGTATVNAGDGNMVISAGGADNTITAGDGNDVINLGGIGPGPGGGPGCMGMGGSVSNSTTIPVTADMVALGNGNNAVFLGGAGDTVHDGSGSDTIRAVGGDDTFVINAAGGTDTIAGFSPSNGDVLDLTSILAGVSLAADLSNLGSFVAVANVADPRFGKATDTVLTITGGSGTATVTLFNTGSLTLTQLEKASLVLPT